jgi:predicted regulator of Ras-like GTPase activity (Roadblock/LC7/MglB family)
VTEQFRIVLERITRISGVRGVLLVTADDGLVVADALMEGVRGHAVAALAANLTKRFDRVSRAATAGTPRFVHLQAENGTLVIVPAAGGVLVVTIGGPEMNVGLARLEMLRAVEVVA